MQGYSVGSIVVRAIIFSAGLAQFLSGEFLQSIIASWTSSPCFVAFFRSVLAIFTADSALPLLHAYNGENVRCSTSQSTTN